MGHRACVEAMQLWRLVVEDEGEAEDRVHVQQCERCRQRYEAIREQTRFVCAAATECDDAALAVPRFEQFFECDRQPATHDHVLPSRVGRYLILDQLDAGGQSVVYRGWDPVFRRPVAVKLMAAQRRIMLSGTPAGFDEPALLAEFRHKNLVEVFDCGTIAGRPYIVMELVDGRTLREVALSGKLSAKTIRRVMIQLAEVVAQAHGHRIVHLDLKPENVMLDGAGNVKLIDFGLAFLFGRQRPSATDIRGTPEYMSPEQSRGDTEKLGPATDVFGLGAVLYFLMTGETLFDRDLRDEPQTRIALERVYRRLNRSGHNWRLIALCRKSLAIETHLRFADAREFHSALTRVETTSRRMKWGLLLLGTAAALLLTVTSLIGVRHTIAESGDSGRHSATPATVRPFLKPDLYLHFSATLPSSSDSEVVVWSAASKSVPFSGKHKPVAGVPNACELNAGPLGMELSCRAGPIVALLATEHRMGASTANAVDNCLGRMSLRDWLGREGVVQLSNNSIDVEGLPLNKEQLRQVADLQRAMNRYGVRFTAALVSVPRSTGKAPHRSLSLDLIGGTPVSGGD